MGVVPVHTHWFKPNLLRPIRSNLPFHFSLLNNIGGVPVCVSFFWNLLISLAAFAAEQEEEDGLVSILTVSKDLLVAMGMVTTHRGKCFGDKRNWKGGRRKGKGKGKGSGADEGGEVATGCFFELSPERNPNNYKITECKGPECFGCALLGPCPAEYFRWCNLPFDRGDANKRDARQRSRSPGGGRSGSRAITPSKTQVELNTV